MKKSEIEKRKLANRLRKKINENKNDNIIISDGKVYYSLNESELRNLVSEAVKNVITDKHMNSGISKRIINR
ncbi:MAG: hypothetical protein VZR33_01505 [Methanosphaera sp.]|nr:hypothetical protein [Methanosphaera sp.]